MLQHPVQSQPLELLAAEELLAALDAAAAHSGPSRITLQADSVYRLNETLAMTKAHSGASAAAPVVWRAAPGVAAGARRAVAGIGAWG